MSEFGVLGEETAKFEGPSLEIPWTKNMWECSVAVTATAATPDYNRPLVQFLPVLSCRQTILTLWWRCHGSSPCSQQLGQRWTLTRPQIDNDGYQIDTRGKFINTLLGKRLRASQPENNHVVVYSSWRSCLSKWAEGQRPRPRQAKPSSRTWTPSSGLLQPQYQAQRFSCSPRFQTVHWLSDWLQGPPSTARDDGPHRHSVTTTMAWPSWRQTARVKAERHGINPTKDAH